MSMDWTEIEIFKGIDLNDSFVIDWNYSNGELTFDLEASVWPESEFYSKPKNGEYTCYRKATLSFVGTSAVGGLLPKDKVPYSNDPDASIDYGYIDSLCKLEGAYMLSGNFGSLKISGGDLRFEIHT